MLAKFPRHPLTFGPTPIEKLARLTIDEGSPRHVFHYTQEPRVRQFLQTYHDRNSF